MWGLTMRKATSKIQAVITAATLLYLSPVANAQVVISEFMADNNDTLTDSDGDTPDYLYKWRECIIIAWICKSDINYTSCSIS